LASILQKVTCWYFAISNKFFVSLLKYFYNQEKKLMKTKPLISCSFFLSKYTLISSSAEGNYFPEKKTAWNLSKMTNKQLTVFPSLFYLKLYLRLKAIWYIYIFYIKSRGDLSSRD